MVLTVITAIFSLDSKNGIGVGGDLAIFDKDDMHHFKEYTTGKICVVGFNTFIQVKNLKNREIILYNPKKDDHNCVITGVKNLNKSEVLELASTNDVMIIGGLATYKEFADVTDKIILTQFREHNPRCSHFLDIDTVYPQMTCLETIKETSKFTIFRITK